jgi:hypothetical protein
MLSCPLSPLSSSLGMLSCPSLLLLPPIGTRMRQGIALCCWSCWVASVTTGGPIALASAGGMHTLPSSPAHGAWGHGGGPRVCCGPLAHIGGMACCCHSWVAAHVCRCSVAHFCATLGPWLQCPVPLGNAGALAALVRHHGWWPTVILSSLLVGTHALSTCPVHAHGAWGWGWGAQLAPPVHHVGVHGVG